MKKKAIVLALSAVFLTGVFAVAAPRASAVTLEEIQNQLQFLLGQVKQLQVQSQSAAVLDSVSWCHDFKTNLRRGNKRRRDNIKDVAALHIALEKDGFAIAQDEKTNQHFGNSTGVAVIAFQEKYKDEILTPINETKGTGIVANTTRAKLNQLYSCGTIPRPTITSPSITVLSPSFGPIGTKVELRGFSFTLTNNVIQFGPIAIPSNNADLTPSPEVRSDVMYFTIPQSGSSSCAIDGICTKDLVAMEPGKTYPVKVINANGESNSVNFTVTSITPPSITVLSPNGGEKLEVGKTFPIKWSTSNVGAGAKFMIRLWQTFEPDEQGHGRDNQFIGNIAFVDNTGLYNWTIPNALQTNATSTGNGIIISGNYKIEISGDFGNLENDFSNAPFSVVAGGSGLTQDQIDMVLQSLKSSGVAQSIMEKVLLRLRTIF